VQVLAYLHNPINEFVSVGDDVLGTSLRLDHGSVLYILSVNAPSGVGLVAVVRLAVSSSIVAKNYLSEARQETLLTNFGWIQAQSFCCSF
jgi:hypothetical protein